MWNGKQKNWLLSIKHEIALLSLISRRCDVNLYVELMEL